MLYPSQIEKFRKCVEMGKADVKNISLSPYILEDLLDSYEQLKQMLAEKDKARKKTEDLRRQYSTIRDVAASREEALIKMGGELKVYKHKYQSLCSRLGVPFKKGHWIVKGNQAQCDICNGITFIGDLDEELPYNFCPNCGLKMERMRL